MRLQVQYQGLVWILWNYSSLRGGLGAREAAAPLLSGQELDIPFWVHGRYPNSRWYRITRTENANNNDQGNLSALKDKQFTFFRKRDVFLGAKPKISRSYEFPLKLPLWHSSYALPPSLCFLLLPFSTMTVLCSQISFSFSEIRFLSVRM